ncbi:MAG TPA: hypothetical protein VJT54_11905 [Verrucomicrobiae bacterium]|nr:hypothetical protein [Verrucomicrobiae bacterium]
MPEKEYQRLTRARSRSAFAIASMSRSSLWLGQDHLLCIDSSGYLESYKRFYFRDIQAISIQRTERRQWWTIILGCFAFIFFILTVISTPKTSPAQWSGGEIAGGIFLGGLTGLFLLLLLINLSLGPTCKCLLRTAVQIEELPSLNRLHRVRRALARLRPLIVAAQGELAPGEISSRMRVATGTLPKTETAMAPEASISPPTASQTPGAPPVIP